MPYQVDAWGGELHQEHAGATRFEAWSAAAEFMASLVDAGLLCNVLHTDFKAPEARRLEAEDALRRYIERT